MTLLFAAFTLFILFVLLLFFASCCQQVNQDISGGFIKNLEKYPRSKAEAAAIKILERMTGQPFPTQNPEWLVWKGKTLELDGYNKSLGIAMEFSGPLHTKWYPAIEEYTKYYDRVVKDIVKEKLCKKHGVNLIVLDVSLPRIHWQKYIESRLHDFGWIKEKPYGYIEKQRAKPFRNKVLERELLLSDIKAAKALR